MEWDRGLRYSGVVTVVVTLAGVFAATLVSPAFQWTGNALSNLGVTATAAGTPLTVLLFNGGLVAGGVVGLAFAFALARATGDRLTAASLAVTLVLMGLIGVFPQDQPLHFPVAAGFYLFITVTLWLDGALRLREGWHERAAVSFLLGVVNIGALVVWSLTGSLTRPGLAIPETVGAVAFATWALLVSLELFPDAPTDGDI